MLIDALKKIQKQHGYLPENELEALSERAKIPMYEIHGVASFFPNLPDAASTAHCAAEVVFISEWNVIRAVAASASSWVIRSFWTFLLSTFW